MKLNKAIVKKLIASINRRESQYSEIFTAYREALNGATKVEDIVKAKQDLLLGLTEAIPLGVCDCYFCLRLHNINRGCLGCAYRQQHGICVVAQNSSYMKVCQAKEVLSSTITKEYYKGETY